MSKKINSPDSNYTQQIKNIIEVVFPKDSGFGSVYEDARHYFGVTPSLIDEIRQLKARIDDYQAADKNTPLVDELKRKLKTCRAKLEDERIARLHRIRQIALQILELSEGDTYEETQHLSAKFLGTIMLTTRGAVPNFQRYHQRLKPLYKVVLGLRLTDKLIADEIISHPYLFNYREALSRYQGNRHWRERWQEEVAIPLVMGALLQDIGLQSPTALDILHGEDRDKDEFRVLDNDERKRLLKLNYHYTLDYLKNGLGIPGYVGNDRTERDAFIARHKAANEFMIEVVKDAFVSKSGIGELLKIPQIYVSILLSTKPDYSRKSLPKGYMLIEQLAKKGSLNAALAEAFIKIVGYFPQGFGITYIPRNEKGFEREQYECAIVTQLNPEHPAEPVCRAVTRNLTYISSGGDEVIRRSSNLFFPANRKKLMRIGRERLQEIMSLLSKDFNPEDVDELIPSYWEPSNFFATKKHQNLWNKG
ncbi:hypothetical protein DXV75_13150 [Alteromonas aestuariivivens]|uniref:Uncharacterized protein n=1 Tax=Alteromonas aestuariivivens TaxID=1938339 RepID=A0A3D8M4N9_9ALTE|nr:hypothetical protein [Alteromonas aestuariivivens]RDV24703.1 hypothetical protein DXV75_13150 [Alteromonas aestuariivivens]